MTQPIEIVARPFKMGDREMVGGDLFDPSDSFQKRFLNDQACYNLRRIGQVIPLTTENYRIATARHKPGHIGRGFTRAFLEAQGIMEREAAAPPPAAAKPPRAPRAPAGVKAKAEPNVAATPVDLQVIEIPAAAEPINGYFLVPVKVGNSTFTHFDVCDKAGKLLRAKRFKGRDQAISFLKGLPSTEAAGGATSGGDGVGGEDDVQLQRKSDDAD